MPRMRSMWRRSATRSSSVRCSEPAAPAGPSAVPGAAVFVAMWLFLVVWGRRRGSPPSARCPAPAPRDLRDCARISLLVLEPSRRAAARHSDGRLPSTPMASGGRDEGEPLWRSRLRWRLRGAMLWPAFGPAVVLDAVLLHVLPIAGEGRPGPVAALLLSTFFNLVVVAVLAPLAGRRLRARRPGTPKVVADDQAGTVLLGALAVSLLALGLAHRPAVKAEDRDFEAQSLAVRAYVAHQAPAPFRANIDRADTWRQGPDLFRTCIPGPDPRRALCLIVSTD